MVIKEMKVKGESPVGSINQLWFIVLTQNSMCGQNSSQPAILIFIPVFVNNRLCVAGGEVNCGVYDGPAPVERYNEGTNTWSVVPQKHIPPNNLGAVEIEGRVYFIINKFPVDSGIRIPPGELYSVPLGEWEDVGKIEQSAVLCHLPLERECIKTE